MTLALATLGLTLSVVPLWSSRLLARALSGFFQRSATVGEVHYRLFPFEVEIRDVRVAGPAPDAPAFLEIPRVIAVPALKPLWERRAVLSRLRLERPRLRIHAYREGGDDIPKLKPS